MTTKFQEELVRRTAELAGTEKIKLLAQEWAEKLTKLGFQFYSTGETFRLYADRFYGRMAVEWMVEESIFSHTILIRSGAPQAGAIAIPPLESQYQVFLSLLAEELGGVITAFSDDKECGCQITILAIIGEGWYIEDEWNLIQECERHSR